MIIFIFRQYASAPYLPGGTRHYEIAKAMVDDGASVYIFCSNFSHSSKKHCKAVKDSYRIELIDGVNFVWLHTSSYKKNGLLRLCGMIQYSINAYKASVLLSSHLNISPDIIIGSSAHLFAVLSAQKVAKRFKSKFWFDIGDLWPEALVSAGTMHRYHPLAILFSILSSYLYKKAELILVLTAQAKKKLELKKIEPNKILVFPPGKNIKTSYSGNIFAVNRKKLTLTYTGSFNPIYPIEELIDAINLLRETGNTLENIKLSLVGSGEKKSELMEKVKSMSLCDVIHFPQPVPKSQLPSIYAKSDVLIVIEKNIEYGFPNKLIDYLFAGKPVMLATEFDYQLDTQCVLKCKPKAKSILREILKFTEMSQDERMLRGSDGLEYALKKFDMTKNYYNILRRYLIL